MSDSRHNGAYVHEALVAEGFKPIEARPGDYWYEGLFEAHGRSIACEIWVRDTDFLRLPKLKILDPSLMAHSVAHFEDSGFYCYTNLENQIIEKYDPRGAIRTILDMMKAAIADHFKAEISEDISREFLQHWFPSLIYHAELVGSGDRIGVLRPITLGSGDGFALIDHNRKRTCFGALKAQAKRAPKIEVPVIAYSGDLTFPNGYRQPENLKECCEWLNALTPGLGDRVIGSFDVKAKEQRLWVAIEAENLTIGIEIVPTLTLNRIVRDVISKQLIDRIGQSIKVNRIGFIQGSREDMFGRNLGSETSNLSGKHIALIGLGTIGSHLAKLIVQSGGGFGDGHIVLIDNDELKLQNLGRHFLGQNCIGMNKAKACESELLRQFPEASIKAVPSDATELLDQLGDFDLIIDATGEEAVSVIVNEWLVDTQKNKPTLTGLFVWLYGNAEAAQTLLVEADNGACYRCLKPKHGGLWRYEPRRAPKEMSVDPGGCGDTAFIPYGVGGSVIAAGLASNLALAWANGVPAPKLRTIGIDQERTRTIKPVNPAAHKDCKACDRAVQLD